MDEPFLGTEALNAGELTRDQLRRRCVRVYRDVYLARDVELTPKRRARACWLRSRRRGILAGFSASALHGSRWINPAWPAAIIDSNRRPAAGVRAWEESIECDEISVVDGMRVTTPARTALDIARRYPINTSVAAIDALAQAVTLKPADIELLVSRYRGRRGMCRARAALDLIDDGAQSPKESWLRLLLIRGGLPAPQTQIPVRDEFGCVVAYLDMGWEDILVAVEYDGDHHRTDRVQYVKDIRRLEMVEHRGWILVRVVAGDHPLDVLRRVRAARARRA
ncbi:type IV toxin-antitoxin system AbiEi family antitoxin [Candidatus Mycobacterium wuenschmannii]|uniref:Type IV toxin-antitoxin system AbiEi family antitoxin n=1 Tax=Candidatus Mycobacterium wuenschmannii TaxID=3027808 RepID=A0ABY8W0D6_9MYCO|nr:type IV toxin-antitoxin system AbiEi family antitoxin [Candidatus Mycobacterium wuenschmannii]WIM88690.1 type IV toxin-antitoxin system AbiEi family antitoxin [Candidatus Mycobacterium wuenschmannii]